jgi:hypothetical protein
MNRSLYLLVVLALAACGQGARTEQAADSTAGAADTTAASAMTPLPAEVVGERAGGAVTLMDTINGKPVISLNDNTLLNSGPVTDGWALAVIETPIDKETNKSGVLKKGSTIMQLGQPVGETLADIPLEDKTQDTLGNFNASLYAYLQEQYIKPGSVIETALRDHLQQHSDRSLSSLQPFIDRFGLEAWDDLKPYRQYTNYESRAEDPSPGFRMLLIFHEDKLIGAADSRPLQLPGATAEPLEKGYQAVFFDDVDKKRREDYRKQFNKLINSVD